MVPGSRILPSLPTQQGDLCLVLPRDMIWMSSFAGDRHEGQVHIVSFIQRWCWWHLAFSRHKVRRTRTVEPIFDEGQFRSVNTLYWLNTYSALLSFILIKRVTAAHLATSFIPRRDRLGLAQRSDGKDKHLRSCPVQDQSAAAHLIPAELFCRHLCQHDQWHSTKFSRKRGRIDMQARFQHATGMKDG